MRQLRCVSWEVLPPEHASRSSVYTCANRAEIVITNSSDGNSYLAPTPRPLLDLARLVSNVSVGLQLSLLVSIDNAGNITVFAWRRPSTSSCSCSVTLDKGDPDPGPVSVRYPTALLDIAHASHKAHPHK